jgi:two-component system, chemotaxis family, sensor kinase CheA
MLNAQTESLLQEMATELAFLMPARLDGLSQVADVLAQLGQEAATQSLTGVQQELAGSLALCRQALASQEGLTQAELDGLQASFELLSNALYLAKPTPQQIQPQALDSVALAHNEASFVLGQDDDLELLNEFCNEGRDLLHQVEQGVLVLEENPKHKDTLNQVFRAFHTFKGGAGFLGIDPIKHLAHQLESLLDAARRDQLSISREVIEVILAGGDALQQYVNAIDLQLKGQGRGQAIVVPTCALLARAQACLEGKPLAPVAAQALVVPTTAEVVMPDPVPLAPLVPLVPLVSEISPSPKPEAFGSIDEDSLANSPRPVPAESGGPRSATPKAVARTESLAQFVKLDTRKLDALVDLVGELVIAQSMVVQHPGIQAHKDRDLERHLRQLSRITTDLQHNAMSMRMVPVRSVMQKMTRLVRDLATAQNKQVQLHLSGEDTELDRNIVEELADPLLHMMRNAVDHGIESPAERQGQGKSAQGNIHLHAAHQGGGILISIRDDGKGLDSAKILSKARQRGLIPADSMPSEKDIYSLIFLPGFSTAESVTEISGRGVGMDVVRGGINKLRGRVDIDSVPGQGTTFNIFLPLTLAIIDGMLVGVGQERFIVPTLAIRESLRPQPGMVSTVQGKGEVISVRGKLIPLVRLSDKLGLPCVAQDPCDGIVVVVDSGARNRALLVDSLIGKQEVVIKSLGDTFKHQKGMSGAAIMGDGRVALIIDPDAIGQGPSTAQLAA